MSADHGVGLAGDEARGAEVIRREVVGAGFGRGGAAIFGGELSAGVVNEPGVGGADGFSCSYTLGFTVIDPLSRSSSAIEPSSPAKASFVADSEITRYPF